MAASLHPTLVRMLAKRNAPPAPPETEKHDFIDFEMVTHLHFWGHLRISFMAARVARVEFDGTTFSDHPLEWIRTQSDLDMVLETMDKRDVLIESRTRTPTGTKHWTYFGIKDAFGNVTWAGPEDLIVVYQLVAGHQELMVVPHVLAHCFLQCQTLRPYPTPPDATASS